MSVVARDADRRSLTSAVRLTAESVLRRANFVLPGVVESFDRATARANVRPALDQLAQSADGEVLARELPLVLDVPVVYPSGGGFGVFFPLAAGDDVLLLFSQRGLTAWKQRLASERPRGRTEPDRAAFHRLADAVAIPGFTAGAAGIPANAIDIRTPADGELLVNGEPAGNATGSLIASANLSTGTRGSSSRNTVPHGTLTLASGVPTGYSRSGGQLRVGLGAATPISALGITALTRDGAGIIDRVVLPFGVAGNAYSATVAEKRILFVGRGSGATSRRISIQRTTSSFVAAASTVAALWEDANIPSGVSLEYRFATAGI